MTNPIRKGIGTLTIRELVERASRLYSNRPLFKLHGDDGRFDGITYEEFHTQLINIATGLYDLGLGKGDQVGLVGVNSHLWATAFLTVMSAGMLVVPLDANLKPDERRDIINRSDIVAIISAPDYLDEFSDRTKFEGEFTLISTEGGERSLRDLEAVGEGLRKDGDRTYEEIEVNLTDTAELIFTSGTTGASKGVVLTHRNLGSNVNQIYQHLPYSTEDTFLSLLPLHHTFESTAGLLIPVSGGCSIIYARSYKSKDIISDIREGGVTMICGVPRLYSAMAKGIQRGIAEQNIFKRGLIRSLMSVVRGARKVFGWNWSYALFRSLRKKAGLGTMRMFISGAAPLPPKVAELFHTLGLRLLQGYGLTETSPVVSVNPFEGYRPETIGTPIPGVEIKIHQPDEEGVGELWIKGDNVMSEYYQNEELTEKAIVDGWFRTGDLGFEDPDGHFHITGRLKNMIVTSSGKSIYPEEIEVKLELSPAIEDAVVLPVENIRTGREEVGAIIHPHMAHFREVYGEERVSGEDVKREVVREVQEVMKGIAEFKRVRSIAISWDGFEKTSTLKVKRHLIDRKDIEIVDGV